MKIKKLKFVGEDKLKVELIFEFDEVKITLFEGGKPTKYTDTYTFTKTNLNDPDDDFETSIIGKRILVLYEEYRQAKDFEKYISGKYEDMVYIEYEIPKEEPNKEGYS